MGTASHLSQRSWFTFGFVSVLTLSISADAGAKASSSAKANDAELTRIHAYLDSQYSAKDVRHSFKSQAGQDIDCIDFFAHPAVKALAARGRPLTEVPTPPPMPAALPGRQRVSLYAFDGQPDQNGRVRACVGQTVPVVRVTTADVLAAGGLEAFLRMQHPLHPLDATDPTNVVHARVQFNDGPNVYFGESSLGVTYSPIPDDGTFYGSHHVSQVWAWYGHVEYPDPQCTTTPVGADCVQTVEAGLLTVPGINPYFVIASTSTGYAYEMTGYRNTALCPGGVCQTWVPQPNSPMAQGMTYPPYNTAGSPWLQPDLDIIVYNYQSSWWIYAGGGWIGHFTPDSFGYTMTQASTGFAAGGEVWDTTGLYVLPMGTGVTPGAGYRQAAYQHDLFACGDKGCSYNFSPVPVAHAGYDLSTTTSGPSSWTNHFYFGSTQPQGSYSQSCSQCAWNGSKLQCECSGILSAREDSSITLPCSSAGRINNNYGQLVCGSGPAQPSGSYTYSCSSCIWNSKFLRCSCRTTSGRYVVSTVSPPCDGAYNSNGNLTCSGALGVPYDSYLYSCTNCSNVSNQTLQCECKNTQGNYMSTSLALPCSGGIANSNGILTCGGNPAQPGGSYTNSCYNCSWTGGSLNCQCDTGTGARVLSSLTLPCSSPVTNCNGRLVCGGC